MVITRIFLVLLVLSVQVSFGQEGKLVLPKGHTEEIGSIAFSPDGSLLASGADEEHAILIWDVKTGREVGSLPAQNKALITFSPDGKFLASGQTLGIQLWNIATGEEIRLQDRLGWIYSIAFSPDSKSVASSVDFPGRSYLDKIQIRSVASGQIVGSFSGKIKFACSMAFSPTAPILAISACYSDSNFIELWNPVTGELIETLIERGDRLKFSVDGKTLMARNGNDGMYVFKIPEGQLIHSEASIGYAAGFSKNGEVVAYSVLRKTATFFNLEEKKNSRALHIGSPGHIDYDPCNNVFASIAGRGKIVLLNADKLDTVFTFGETCGRVNRPREISINSIDSCLAIQTEDSTYRVWSFRSNTLKKGSRSLHKWKSTCKGLSRKQQKFLDQMNEPQSVEFSCSSRNGKRLAFSLGGDISLFDVDSDQVIQSFPSSCPLPRCTFSADGKKLIVINRCGVTIFDIVTGKDLGSFVSLGDTDWVFLTPEGLYDGTSKGTKYPHWVVKNQPVLLENCRNSKYVPGLLGRILYGI
jgi:WD40 repeat protein